MAIRTDSELRSLYFSSSGVWPDNVLGEISAADLRAGVEDTYDTLLDPILASGNYSENITYVALNGDDTNGDGSFLRPYRTLYHANDVATGAGPTNRQIIQLGAGMFSESNPINMKPYVNIKGEAPNTTIINATNPTHAINLNENTYIAKHSKEP